MKKYFNTKKEAVAYREAQARNNMSVRSMSIVRVPKGHRKHGMFALTHDVFEF